MQKAPSFFLTAVGAARVVGGPPGPGTTLLLIFHGHTGSETAFNINATVREKYPKSEQLLIASVVDLKHIPRYMRPAVELTLSAAYRQAAKRIPKELDPTEYVVILPDWEGKTINDFEMTERVNDVSLVLLTSSWQIYDSYNGPDPITNALNIVTAAASEAPDLTVGSTASL